ncbi:MAG: hypothetical protein QXN33_01775, partial [Candidatus Bathyarchaeia archaeon]
MMAYVGPAEDGRSVPDLMRSIGHHARVGILAIPSSIAIAAIAPFLLPRELAILALMASISFGALAPRGSRRRAFGAMRGLSIAAPAGLMVYLLLSSAPSAQAASIAEWELITGSMPRGLVAASPGDSKVYIFFADEGGRLGRLDPDTNTILYATMPGAPYDIVSATISASKQEVWFTLRATGEIGYFDFLTPANTKIYKTYAYDFGVPTTSPIGIALQSLVGSRSDQYVLWIAEYGSNSIGMLDPFNGDPGGSLENKEFIYRCIVLPTENSKPWDIVFSPPLNGSFFTELDG